MRTRAEVQAELDAAKKRADEELAAIFEAESKDPGDGYEFCTRDEYKSAMIGHCRYTLEDGRTWSAWGRGCAYIPNAPTHQYRRPLPADRAWEQLAQRLTGREDLSGGALRRELERMWHLRQAVRVEVHDADPPCKGCAGTAIPEPDPGEGYELCGEDDATMRRAMLPRGYDSGWRSVTEVLAVPSNATIFYKHIAKPKPEPKWVACTAKEAREAVKSARTQWLDETTWDDLYNVGHGPFRTDAAYRTTAILDDWLPVSADVFAQICARDDASKIEKTSSRIYGNKVRRDSIPLGTVLG